MKNPLFFVLLALGVSAGFAQESFPGLKAVLTPTEWQRAGLDRLTPDEIGVIDAALIRRQGALTARHQAEITTARQSAPAAAPVASPSLMQRFGLPLFDDNDWRNLPALKAKVTKWEGGNRFLLDNGQVWEGYEPITYELPGKEIEIQARPHGQFALVVDGVNTTLRVMRLR